MKPTFAELYCASRRISTRQYQDRVLGEILYPPARWLRPLLSRTPHYFAADYEFVDSVGLIRSRRDLQAEIQSFVTHPDNSAFRRSVLKLRCSVTRMRELVAEILCVNGN